MLLESNVKAMETAAADARRNGRFKFDARITLMIGQGSTVRGAIGRTEDICQTGISAHLPATLNIGETYDVLFAFSHSSEPLQVKVVLRNRNSFRYGFEFVALSPREKEVIRRNCETLALLERHGSLKRA